MNILISLFFSIILAFSVFAEDIKIIELHDQTIDQILLNATSDNDDVDNEINDDVNNDINNEELRIQFQLLKKKYTISKSEESNPSEAITVFPDFWENADKDELLFLFDNLLVTNSLILNNTLINALTLNSLPPQGFEEDEFNHFKIVNLIKLGQRKKAFNMIETLNEKTDYVDSFNLFNFSSISVFNNI